MAWEIDEMTEEEAPEEGGKTVRINGVSYTVETAEELVEKIKEIAKKNGWSMIDVIDCSDGVQRGISQKRLIEEFDSITDLQILRHDDAAV